MFNGIAAFSYGLLCYVVSLATFAYAFLFWGNFVLAHSIDSSAQTSFLKALLVNSGLVLLFGLQHSVMARPGFKKAWTRIVPASVERSTYLLFSCAALALLFWKWQPMGGVIWHVDSPAGKQALAFLYALGWLVVLFTTFLINHFDLFGLRQVTLKLLGRSYTGIGFRTPGPYRFVRHPLYIGWLMVFWSAPLMTAAHLVFAVGTTLYILVAIRYEERDLVRFHPEYAEYRSRVPMIVPSASAKWRERRTVRGIAAKEVG
jgi:protein-S-isoprenylcysteine O-methyltransferase Ste14